MRKLTRRFIVLSLCLGLGGLSLDTVAAKKKPKRRAARSTTAKTKTEKQPTRSLPAVLPIVVQIVPATATDTKGEAIPASEAMDKGEKPNAPTPNGTVTPLIISEFRVRGPSGANDEFIEIYNNSGADHTVAGGGTGYGIVASDGTARCVIPLRNRRLPNRRKF